jgi:GTP cyclohydrolase FolE2
LAAVQATQLTPSLSPTQTVDEDVQARLPGVPVGLSRVGVTGVEKVVRIRGELFFARL